jgi:AcrR family transcriptional regulator
VAEATRNRGAKTPVDRNQILRSALKLFYQNGYHATTMQDIANEVGVLKGSLYYHISTKEELLLDLLTTSIEDVLKAVAKASDEGGTALERLRRLVRAELMTMAEHQREIAVWQTERRRMQPLLRDIDVKARATDDLLRNVLLDGANAGEWPADNLDTAYQAIRGMIVWFTSWYRPDGKLGIERVAARFSDYAEAIVLR